MTCVQGATIKPQPISTRPKANFSHAKHRSRAAFRAHQPGQRHACRHHGNGIHRLEESRRHLNGEQSAVNKAIDKQADRAAALLRQNPEQRAGQHQQYDLPQRATVLRGTIMRATIWAAKTQTIASR
jgi:hypothetical protein